MKIYFCRTCMNVFNSNEAVCPFCGMDDEYWVIEISLSYY